VSLTRDIAFVRVVRWFSRLEKRLTLAIPVILIVGVLSVTWLSAFSGKSLSTTITAGAPKAQAAELPTYFVANKGQLDDKVDYYIEGNGRFTYLGADRITFTQVNLPAIDRKTMDIDDSEMERSTTIVRFVDAAEVHPEALEQTSTTFNYFLGNQSHTGATAATAVVYKNLWQGIDLEVRGLHKDLKYTFIVHPGANPADIVLEYSGADLSLDEHGNLLAQTPLGTITDLAPVSRQRSNQDEQPVDTHYKIDTQSGGVTLVSFEIGTYDPSVILEIDPTVVAWANLIGSTGYDNANSLFSTDSALYVGGYAATAITSFSGVPGFDLSHNGGTYDGFIVKMALDGQSASLFTYLGGTTSGGTTTGYDGLNAVAVDESGNIYAALQTQSSDYPTTVGAFDTSFNTDFDGAVTKLNPSGSAILYSTYFGGTDNEKPFRMSVDSNNEITLVGHTDSAEGEGFPVTAGATPDNTYNGGAFDGFIGRLNSTFSGFDYLGYVGGAGSEPCCSYDVELDSSGNAYMVGYTGSSEASFPDGNGFGAVSGYDQVYGGSNDGFVVKLNSAGTMTNGTYFGGTAYDAGTAIVLANGSLYLAGETQSTQATGFPVLIGPDLTQNGDFDGFLSRLSTDLTTLTSSGFIGGSDTDSVQSMDADASGDIYIGMFTDSTETSLPIMDGPDLTQNGDRDGWVSKLDAADLTTVFAGFIGGDDWEFVYDLEVAAENVFYVGFESYSSDGSLPTGNGFETIPGIDQTNAGNGDALVVRIETVPAEVIITQSGGSTNISEQNATSDSYTVVLGSQPTADVTVTITPDSNQTADTSSLTFTSTNWNVAQTVTVTAVDDTIRECAHTGTITHTVSSADLNFNGLGVDSVVAEIIDNEVCDLVGRIEDGTGSAFSIAVSKARFADGKADAVLLARPTILVDAFVGNSLAALANGPILITPTDSLDENIKLEIDRVLGGPGTGKPVYLLGGKAALSQPVEDALTAAAYSDLRRFAGRNRNETATLIAEEVLGLNPAATTSVFISENTALIDAITVSARAGNLFGDNAANPILLQGRGKDTPEPFTRTFMATHPEITEANFIGGTAVLTLNFVKAFSQQNPSVVVNRLFGADRYGTARAVADTYFPIPTGVIVSGGEGTPESGLLAALLAGGFAAKNNQPLLITPPTELRAIIESYLTTHAATIVGGTVIGNSEDVSTGVQAAIQALIQ
jgi:hypothetical protein